MTLSELAKRVEALEKAVAELQGKVPPQPGKQFPWWIATAGRFANDPVFDEIVRLGAEYRESLRPKKRKAAKKKRGKAHDS